MGMKPEQQCPRSGVIPIVNIPFPIFLAEAAAKSDSTGVWTIVLSTAAALITTVGGFFFSKRKQRTDDFAAFMEESSDFREEIRKELKRKEEEYEKDIEKYKLLVSKKETELLQLRKDKEDSSVHYKFITDFMPQMLWTASADGNVNSYNGRWYEYTNLPFEQSKDWGWLSVVHVDDAQNAKDEWEDSIRRSRPFEVLLRICQGSTGDYKTFLNRAVPRFDSNGRVMQWVGTITDINDFIATP